MNNQSSQIKLSDRVLLEEVSLVDTLSQLAAKVLINGQNLTEKQKVDEYERLTEAGRMIGRQYFSELGDINEKYIPTYKQILSGIEDVMKLLPADTKLLKEK